MEPTPTFWEVCRRGFSAFLWRYDYDVIELLNGITAIGLGFLLYFSPRDLIAVTGALESLPFATNLSLLSLVLVLLGVWKIFALRYGSLNHRKWLTFFMIFVWAFFAVLLSEGAYRWLVIFLIGELSLFSLWAFIRLMLKHRIERFIDPRDPYHGS